MDIDEGYNDSNRAFLQAFLAQNVLTFDASKPILAAIFSACEGRPVETQDITQDDFNSYISAANSALSPLDLEIRSTFHQVTRDRIYALINTTSDSLTQLATTFTPDEIAFVKRLLDGMFDGQNNRGRKEAMCLSSMDAAQLARGHRRETQNGNTQSAGLTIREGEDVLRRLLDEGWLEKSPKNFYSLSPRALMELRGWLMETYNEPVEVADDEEPRAVDKIKFCHACKDILTVVGGLTPAVAQYRADHVQGQRCSNHDCPCRLHNTCTQNFFRIQRSQNCPVCQTAWDGKAYVGEKAITTSEAYLKGKRRSANRPQRDEHSGDNEDDGTQ